MPTVIEHFTKVTEDTIRALEAKGILRLVTAADTNLPLDLNSSEAQALMTEIATSIYEGTVKEMNPHRAPEL